MNSLNQLVLFNSLTSSQQNALMMIFAGIRRECEKAQKTDLALVSDYKLSVHFTMSELDALFKRHLQMQELIEQTEIMLKKLLHTQISYEDSERKSFEKEQIIYKYKIDESGLTVDFSKRFADNVFCYLKKYTTFTLQEFVALRSVYTKAIFRELKKFRDSGFWRVSLDEFKTLVGIADKSAYKNMTNLDRVVIKPALKELSSTKLYEDQTEPLFKDLKCEKIKDKRAGGRGGKVVALQFTFTPESHKLAPAQAKKLSAQKVTAFQAEKI